QLYERSISLIEKAYGPIHPDRIRFLDDFANFRTKMADSSGALELSLKSAFARAEQLRAVSRGLSERHALAFAHFGTTGLSLALSLASRGIGRSDGTRRAWDALIQSRALVLDEMASRQRLMAEASTDTALAQSFRLVQEARQRYANLLVRGEGEGAKGSLEA